MLLNLQSPPTLESPIIRVTLTPTLNWNQIAKSSLPWYFKGIELQYLLKNL